jgi:cytosine/adenosine deaminase-related metal-dependent hydrolase
MLDEVRHAMLLQRVAHGAAALGARESLRMATRGGASVLGRDDVGYLAPGMSADLIGVRVDSLALAGGAVHDPLAALVFCRLGNVDLSVVNGKLLVSDGKLIGIDLPKLIDRHNRLAVELCKTSFEGRGTE